MKKKHRDITVDGEKYAWVSNGYSVTIWKDKKEILSLSVNKISVTPKYISELIKAYELKGTLIEIDKVIDEPKAPVTSMEL